MCFSAMYSRTEQHYTQGVFLMHENNKASRQGNVFKVIQAPLRRRNPLAADSLWTLPLSRHIKVLCCIKTFSSGTTGRALCCIYPTHQRFFAHLAKKQNEDKVSQRIASTVSKIIQEKYATNQKSFDSIILLGL